MDSKTTHTHPSQPFLRQAPSPAQTPAQKSEPKPKVPATLDAETTKGPATGVDPQKLALLLNKNARLVNKRVIRRAKAILGKERVFVTANLEEAESTARNLVQEGYGTIVTGGGDGTLIQAVNLVRRYIDEANAWREGLVRRGHPPQPPLRMPRFASLPLGTGNSFRHLVGSKNPLRDLKKIVHYAPSRSHLLPLLDVAGELCLFGGMGHDSILLADYNTLKARYRRTPILGRLMTSVLGYFAAAVMRFLPRIFVGAYRPVEATVTTRSNAYYIDPRRGDQAILIPAGSCLFEGPAAMLGFASSPFFGYGFRAFPFASTAPGKFQLRIARINALHVIARLPSIWRGHFRDAKRVHDFLVDDIEISLHRPYPFQHSGDDRGMIENLHVRLHQEPLEVVDMYPPPKAAHSWS